jgi:hypothetical protein
MRQYLPWVSRVSALTLFACALLIVSKADAQILYGSIVGSVEDPSGAVVPNAQITITNQETGQTREATADASGRYTFNSVLPGRYEVKAASAGFQTASRADLNVLANTVARADFKMSVGQVSEQITVAASAVQLQTDRSDTSTTISSKPIQNLPMNQYRNYQTLINLVPGATPAVTQNSQTDTPGRSLATNVNGTANNMNTTRLDGAINVNIWLPHHNAYVAPSEAVAEVNVSTTAMDAEQGMAGGAAVTVITKSGTNDLHGSLWEYHNNQHMKSRPYFMPTQQQKPRDTTNIFGATIGGPVVKNKLFYFGHFEAYRQRTGGSGIYDVPVANVRGGDFSQAFFPTNSTTVTPIYDPLTGDDQGRGRTQFPGNVIPANRISPISRRILQDLPLPNLAGLSNQNFATAGTGIFDRNNYDYKVNYNRTEKHQIWGKSSYLKANVTGVAIFGDLIGPAVVGDPGTGDTFTQLHTVGHTYSLTPNVLLDQNFGYTRMTQTVQGNDFGTNFGSEVFGIPGTNGPDPRQSGMPVFNIGYSHIGLNATWMPVERKEQSFTHDTNLSWVRGAHDIRMGFNYVKHMLDHWQPELANPRGNFDFSGNQTALNGGQASNFYNTFASFLLGQVSGTSKSLQYITMTGREQQMGWYIRDRWQLSRKLTVNLGFRLDYYPLIRRKDSGMELYDPNTNIVTFTGYGNVPVNQGLSINNPLPAPRVGLAYRLTDKTVIRAGYGLTYDPLPFSRPLRGFYPLTVAQNIVSANAYSSVGTLAQGIPEFTGPDLTKGSGPLPANVDMRSPWGAIKRGYIQSWNFTVQQQLPSNFVVSAAYVGTQSTNMLADRNINSGMPGTATTELPYARAFNRRIATNMWDGWLSSNYHSLQTTLDRQFSNGLLLKGAYTWSKAINMADANGWVATNFNSPEVIYRNRARAGYDRTHVLQMAYVYELPVGKGKRFANSGPVSWILGNWSLNGVFYAFSGNPLTIGSGVACNCPGNLQTAMQVKPQVEILGNHGPGQKYFDPTAFSADPSVHPTNTFGNSGRNIVEGPGRIGMDTSVHRVFPIGERFRFELRGDAFNVTNTPQFSNPALSVTGANFGEVRAASGERQLRVGGVIRF